MTLPRAENAFVPERKLTHYLLSESHPVGKAKAQFFLSYGFSPERPEVFADALLAVARTEPVVDSQVAPFGVKYVVDGKLRTPNGVDVAVRTVWQIDDEDSPPRFITAYPS